MLTNYQEWARQREGKGGGKAPNQKRPSSIKAASIKPAETPGTGGILSYNQMKRTSMPHGRAPSEVGSIRSFRSVQTMEERVDMLDEAVTKLSQGQAETQAKLDQILTLLASTTNKTPGQ
jgi:hypothetical protein